MSGQTSAAQSAPAGEREAFEAKYPAAKKLDFRDGVYLNRLGSELPRSVRDGINDAWTDFQAGAAWQRAQGAVPEAKVTGAWESARIGDFNAGWNACRDSVFTLMKKAAYMELDTTKRSIAIQDELRDQLAAAPAHPVERQEPEDLHVWRATTRFGETCHFGEASTARAWAGENGTVERVDLTPVPELRVVERQEQGEVQRLRGADGGRNE